MYPVDVGGYPGVDVRPTGRGAGNGSKGHKSSQQVAIVFEEHQGSPGVAVTLLRIGQPAELGGLNFQALGGVLLLALLNRGNGNGALLHPRTALRLPTSELGEQTLQLVGSELLVGQADRLHELTELRGSSQADQSNIE